MPPTIPGPALEALDAWTRHHDARVPGFVEGLYVVGSIALGDWRPHSDVDILAVSGAPADDATVDALRAAHEATRADFPGIAVDGPFVTWSDLRRPPGPLTCPWTLDGEFHHDDGCFETNPAIWLTLAHYGVAVRGPRPGELDVHVDQGGVRAFVAENTATYWRSLVPSIRGALDDPERSEFDAGMTSWCVLGVARMLYTARTGDVTSKSGAGRWLADEVPRHRKLVEHALAIRAADHPPPDGRAIVRATADYLDDLCHLVEQTTA